MAGYYGGRYQQQQQQQNQLNNNNQNARASPQQYQKHQPYQHQQYQNRKATPFNENSMDAILTCDINDVYPMPEVVIFRRDFNGTNPYALKIFQIEVSLKGTTIDLGLLIENEAHLLIPSGYESLVKHFLS